MPNLKKQVRQKRVITYLQNQLKTGKKVDYNLMNPHVNDEDKLIDLTDKDKIRIKQELNNILNPKSKKKVVAGVQQSTDRWFIDIFAIKYGYVKNSERRKNKGKSKKKLKRVKSSSFLKSIVAQPGMITALKEGRMGMSPKSHMFRLRKEDLTSL
jgi:hypothetical protein